MCIAVIKPKGVQVPTTEIFRNCFTSNPHGAGFAYNRNGVTRIIKGLMTFEEFYNELQQHNIKEDENAFFHFRIATHGLRDGGNTHPFPITNSFQEMRKVEQEYHGFCLIHNGVFHYTDAKMKEYDPTGVISDTMLFSRLISDDLNILSDDFKVDENETIDAPMALAMELKDKSLRESTKLNDIISKGISYCKVAVMDENGEYMKFGNWIEDNGIFYSNYGFSGYGRYGKSYSYPYSSSTNSNTNNRIGFSGGWYSDDYDDDYNGAYRSYSSYDDWYVDKISNNHKHKKRKKRKEYCSYCGEYKRCNFEDGLYICRECEQEYFYETCKGCHKKFHEDDMASKDYCYSCYDEEQDIEEYYRHCEEIKNENFVCMNCGQNFTIKEQSYYKDVCQDCYESVMHVH